MKHKNDYAKSGGSRNHVVSAGRRFGRGRAGLIFLSLDVSTRDKLRAYCMGFLLGMSVLAPSLAAQNYPSRPIRFVNPFPAGGSSDVLARLLGQKLAESLGQPVVVENRPGAGGNIGTELAAKATADGYTMLMGYVGTLAINPALYPKLPYDPVKDFAPVALVAASQLALVLHPSLPAQTLSEFIALAKTRPRQLNYGSGGSGTGPHLAAELFKSMAGVDLTHVPYKGSAPAMNDLLAGQVQVGFLPVLTALPHAKAGKLRPLGVTGTKRLRDVPDWPAIAEVIPGYEVRTWFGVVMPAHTPREIIRRMNSEIAKVLTSSDFAERFSGQGFELLGGSPEEFSAYIRTEIRKWGKVVKDARVQVE